MPPLTTAEQSKSSGLSDADEDPPTVSSKQRQKRPREAADIANKRMGEETNLKVVRKTASKKDKDRHAPGCKLSLPSY